MAIICEVQNISTVMDNDMLQPILSAVEQQVAEDVAPTWGCQTVSLVLLAPGQKFSGNKWQFVVVDTSDVAGAAGYHETQGDEPIGFAFVKTTIDAGMHPSVTISHEMLEMVGDALIDQYNIWSDLPDALFLAQELCDPVEDDSLAYLKNGVLVSDFVTPAFFVPQSKAPWDFKHHLSGPNTLATGGYQLYWNPQSGLFQKFAEGIAKGRAAISTPYSRRWRRGNVR